MLLEPRVRGHHALGVQASDIICVIRFPIEVGRSFGKPFVDYF